MNKMEAEVFRTVGIIGRVGGHATVLESVRALCDVLLSRHAAIYLDQDIACLLPELQFPALPRDEIGVSCDLVIVVGGDGSLLSAARALARHDVPVLGINRGKLGFLTDVRPDELHDKVGAVLDGQFIADNRFLLEIEVVRDGSVVAHADALNDVVMKSGRSARMIEFDLYIDNYFVYTQSSDGLIIATPTGSTAYSLSGGGPIMHPSLDAVVVVPMFPHTLSSRPIVVDSRSEIRMVVTDCHPQISCDGQVHMNLLPNDEIFVNKKPHRLKLIHPLDHDFYKTCRDKLGWGSRPTGQR